MSSSDIRLLDPVLQPSVSVTMVEDVSYLTILDKTSTLLLIEKSRLLCSNDCGITLGYANGIDSDVKVKQIEIDPFFNWRAFASSDHAVYITNDQGLSWRKISLPMEKSSKELHASFSCKTRPFNKDHIIIDSCTYTTKCCESHEDKTTSYFTIGKAYSFFSNDGGKSFTRILPSESSYSSKTIHFSRCEFISVTKDSQLRDESTILCLFEGPSDNTPYDCIFKKKLFKTVDSGKTVTKVDQFDGYRIDLLEILKGYVLVFTRDGISDNSRIKIWVSKDGCKFHEARLPSPIYSMFDNLESVGDKILLTFNKVSNEEDQVGKTSLLISDSTGLSFFELTSVPPEDGGIYKYYHIMVIDQLKGIVIKTYCSYLAESETTRKSSEISIDKGQTWTKLRLQSPEDKELCDCDFKPIKNCSLQIVYTNESFLWNGYSKRNISGVLMSVGLVSDWHHSDSDDLQTYISRDSGISWTKAFDMKMKYAFSESRDIILAIPDKSGESKTSNVYYSLDRGHTWTCYHLGNDVSPFELFGSSIDDSNTRFILAASSLCENQNVLHYIYVFDFSELLKKKAFGKVFTDTSL